MVGNPTGGTVERLSYDAQGKRRFANGGDDVSNSLRGVTTDFGFTGHEHLDDLGLIHMNGRLYDPRIGRFVSGDPRGQDWRKPQTLNRYSYVKNNPLKYVDPSGFDPDCAESTCDSVEPDDGGPGPNRQDRQDNDAGRIGPDDSPEHRETIPVTARPEPPSSNTVTPNPFERPSIRESIAIFARRLPPITMGLGWGDLSEAGPLLGAYQREETVGTFGYSVPKAKAADSWATQDRSS